jgi:oxygen-independent coproporphyrinogen-3 oxidase
MKPGLMVAGASGSGNPRAQEMQWHPGWNAGVEMLAGAWPARAEGAFERHLAGLDRIAARADDALSLSVKLPFCAARCLHCERGVCAAQADEAIDDYVASLVGEIDALAARIGGRRDVLQLHLGGGTVSELGVTRLSRLMHALERHWRLPDDAELSSECDPRRASWAQLRLLAGLGLRRITFGVFDLDPAVQQAIGRHHSAALIEDACDLARRAGIDCVTLDLMIGLPQQDAVGWQETLTRVVAIAPDRVRLARYRHQPGIVPSQAAITRDALPAPDQRDMHAAQAVDTLCRAGYRWIGADLFVLESDPLALALERGQLRRSLISYTATPPTPVLGLGAGAVGEIDGDWFWSAATLPSWRDTVRAGRPAVAHAGAAGAHDARRRIALQHLLCGLELPATAARDGLEPAYQRLAAHAAAGLVQPCADRLVVTPRGRHELPLLCGEFNAAVAAQEAAGAHA